MIVDVFFNAEFKGGVSFFFESSGSGVFQMKRTNRARTMYNFENKEMN